MRKRDRAINIGAVGRRMVAGGAMFLLMLSQTEAGVGSDAIPNQDDLIPAELLDEELASEGILPFLAQWLALPEVMARRYIPQLQLLGPLQAWEGTAIVGSGLESFYNKLRRLEKGELEQVTVLHVGDSHVSSQSFSRAIATPLQTHFGGRGGTFCYPHPKGGSANQGHPDAQRGAAEHDDICSPITAVPYSNSGKGIRYYSYGNPGKTFSWYALQPCLPRLLQSPPDLVIVTLGTNDAFAKLSYQAAWKSIDSFVAVVRAHAPGCPILLTTPPDSYFRDGSENTHIAVMEKVILDYAGKRGVAAWDFYAAMGGAGSINLWLASGWAKGDRIHLTPKGYSIKGKMLYKSLMKGYLRFLKS